MKPTNKHYSKSSNPKFEEVKQIGECLASNDLITELSTQYTHTKSDPIATSEEALTDYKKGISLAGSAVYQMTPSVCKKETIESMKEHEKNPKESGILRGGKCQFMDKTRKVIQNVTNREEVGVKDHGESKGLTLNKQHKSGLQKALDSITDLKKEYKCKYD